MKQIGLFILLICGFGLNFLNAQTNGGDTKWELDLKVRQGLTKRPFDTSKYRPLFEIYNASDTSVIRKTFNNGVLLKRSQNDLLIRISAHKMIDGAISDEECDDYECEWIRVNPSDEELNSGIVTAPTVFLNLKKQSQLKEVTVTASKIMFYHKGDTLVYNADAFVLSEGSMLDALLNQMPGVELKKNGVVYCNGRRVDNLLLNGKDLFRGKNELMLENLPAYTVKDIAVYDKRGRASELMQMNLAGDMTYVMDIRLKRQYKHGFLMNAEAGYGSHDRYLGKLFGLWFSDNVSMSVHASANNLSDGSTPGKDDGAWSKESVGNGVSTRQMGGLSYLAEGYANAWEIKGNIDVSNTHTDAISFTNKQSYFSTGDSYNYSWKNDCQKTFSASTFHSLFLKIGNKSQITVMPSLKYVRKRGLSSALGATFNEEIENITSDMVNSIYSEHEDLTSSLLNRSSQRSLKRGDELNLSANAKYDLRTKSEGLKNMLSFDANMAYKNISDDLFSRYILNYGAQSNPVFDQNQFFDNDPDFDREYSGKIQFAQYLTRAGSGSPLRISYQYRRKEERRTSQLYYLNEIDYSGELGTLPSVTEYAPTISPANSYKSFLIEDEHKLDVNLFQHYIMWRNVGNLMITADLPITILSRTLDYDGRNTVSRINRTDLLIGTELWIALLRGSNNFSISAKTTPQKVDMINLLDINDATDPLMTYLGNINLVNARTNHFSISFGKWKKQTRFEVVASYDFTNDAIGRGYIYNPLNGATINRMYNVDGNWSARLSFNAASKLRSLDKFNFDSKLSGEYRNSVDLSGTMVNEDATAIPPKRTVTTSTVKEDLKLNWQTDDYRISALINVKFNNYKSDDPGFENFTSWTCNYGMSGLVNLPKNWSLSTDLTLYTRRGFTDSRLNTTDVIWNARISKSILKGALVFVVDGYDMLQQLSNVTYMVNAQARTETVSNVIPSYVLFHIQYRFNRQPKKH